MADIMVTFHESDQHDVSVTAMFHPATEMLTVSTQQHSEQVSQVGPVAQLSRAQARRLHSWLGERLGDG